MRRAAEIACAAIALSWPAIGAAQSASERAAMAQGLYESAAQLIRSGDWAAACPKLEESQRLEPAMGTLFFLATCYEGTGRPTSAWSLFLDVEGEARAAGNATREATARARAAALEPKLPRLTVDVPERIARLPGLEVTRDGLVLNKPLWGTAVPVDFGDHVVRVTATGKAPWTTTVRVGALGQRVDVRVAALRDAGAPIDVGSQPPAPLARNAEPPSVSAERASPQRAIAIVGAGLGLAGIAAGSVMGVLARSTWHDAEARCPSHAACSRAAHDMSLRAIELSTGSTVGFAAGGAAIVGGAILWLTAPPRRGSTALVVAPAVAPSASGAFVSGVF